VITSTIKVGEEGKEEVGGEEEEKKKGHAKIKQSVS
jgi:hypothetical protein